VRERARWSYSLLLIVIQSSRLLYHSIESTLLSLSLSPCGNVCCCRFVTYSQNTLSSLIDIHSIKQAKLVVVLQSLALARVSRNNRIDATHRISQAVFALLVFVVDQENPRLPLLRHDPTTTLRTRDSHSKLAFSQTRTRTRFGDSSARCSVVGGVSSGLGARRPFSRTSTRPPCPKRHTPSTEAPRHQAAERSRSSTRRRAARARSSELC